MFKERLNDPLSQQPRTLLSIGPVSLNCIQAVIEIAPTLDTPLTLIASRRQIDATSFGGGYVNNWTTPEFAAHMKRHDPEGKIILGRDHSGPWQHDNEINAGLSLDKAMASAKTSLATDIHAGIEFIHLDPSFDPSGTPTPDEALHRLFDLYSFTWSTARQEHKDLIIEVGPFDNEIIDTPERLEYCLEKIARFCHAQGLPMPDFIVVKTGTLVMETRNIGPFQERILNGDNASFKGTLRQMIGICERYGVMAKEHNCDYLGNATLACHPVLGIHAANIAPELGVAETSALLQLLSRINRNDLIDEFIALAVASDKWKKWMLPETQPALHDLALIAGHYVFSNPRCSKIKNAARPALQKLGIDLDNSLKDTVKENILRYLDCFGLLKEKASACL